MGLYNAAGRIPVTLSDGSAYTGLYAAEGYNAVTSPGGSYVGTFAPSGGLYVTVAAIGTGVNSVYSLDGSRIVIHTVDGYFLADNRDTSGSSI